MSAPIKPQRPGSIRFAMIKQLATGGIVTIDDLVTQLDEPRKKLQDNIVHAVKEGLIERLRDDVTRAPAYRISPKGREYLASAEALKPKAFQEVVKEAPKDPSIAGEKPTANALALDLLERAMPGFTAEFEKQHKAEIEPEEIEPVAAALIIETVTEHHAVIVLGKLIFHGSLEGAESEAMRQARNGIRAEVYKLVSVGSAIPAPGADWIPA